MEDAPSFQLFISDQLAAACSRIVAEYERLQCESEDRAPPPADEGERARAPPNDERTGGGGPTSGGLHGKYFRRSSTTSSRSAASTARSNGPAGVEGTDEQPRASAVTPDFDTLRRDIFVATSSLRRRSTVNPSPAQVWAEKREGDCIFDPNTLWYRTWQNAIALVVVFSIFFTPIRYAFQDKSSWATRMDYCIDALFGLDILLTFNVAGTTKNGLVWHRWPIVVNYIYSLRFWIDVIAVLPLSELASLGGVGPGTDALNLLRLLRANRILILFRELQKNAYLNLMGVVMAKFVLFIVLCTHTAGCVFYALANHRDFDEDTWVARVDPELPHRPWYSIYVHMLYWAVGTFKAGPAHGMIFPGSDNEMLMACFTMMVNIFLQTYLVSSMAALLTTADVRIYAMRNRLTQLAEFSARYGLTPELTGEIRSYIRFKFSTNQELDQNVLGGLPEIYRQRISHALYDALLSSLLIFHGCSIIFLKQLHGALESMLHMRGHDLIHVDDPSTELQILADGEAAVYYEDEFIEMRFGGECLAAVPFVCQVAQPFLVRTQKLCRVLSLRRSAWDAACLSFPEDVGHVKANLLVDCNARKSSFEVEAAGHSAYGSLIRTLESHTAQQHESAISSLCFAAASGDVAKIKRILRAHTADCADYDNRSPLHIAASKGQMAALELLVSRAAGVNAMDNFGRTPLMEALRSREEPAAQYLYDQGGSLGYSQRRPSRRHATEQEGGAPGANSSSAQSMHAQAAELCEAASDAQMLWYLAALIRYGADVNAADYDARTALHVASAVGNKDAVELLLRCEDVQASPVDRFGRTPLMEAVRHAHEPCARLLRAQGASHGFTEDANPGAGANAVHAGQELCQAAFANQTVYLHNLITHCGISADAADYDLRTALMLACAEGNTDAAVALVQLGADTSRRDRWGHTALTEAREHGHRDLEMALRQLDRARRRRPSR